MKRPHLKVKRNDWLINLKLLKKRASTISYKEQYAMSSLPAVHALLVNDAKKVKTGCADRDQGGQQGKQGCRLKAA